MAQYVRRHHYFIWLMICIIAPGILVRIIIPEGDTTIIDARNSWGLSIGSGIFLWWSVTVPALVTFIIYGILKGAEKPAFDIDNLDKEYNRRIISLASGLGWAHGLEDGMSDATATGLRSPYSNEDHPKAHYEYTKAYWKGFDAGLEEVKHG